MDKKRHRPHAPPALTRGGKGVHLYHREDMAEMASANAGVNDGNAGTAEGAVKIQASRTVVGAPGG